MASDVYLEAQTHFKYSLWKMGDKSTFAAAKKPKKTRANWQWVFFASLAKSGFHSRHEKVRTWFLWIANCSTKFHVKCKNPIISSHKMPWLKISSLSLLVLEPSLCRAIVTQTPHCFRCHQFFFWPKSLLHYQFANVEFSNCGHPNDGPPNGIHSVCHSFG